MPIASNAQPRDELQPAGTAAVKIGKAVLGYRTRGRAKSKGRRRPGLAFLRRKEIMTFFEDAFGGPVTTDEADYLLEPFAAHVAWAIEESVIERGEPLSEPTLVRLTAEYLTDWFPNVAIAEIGAVAARMAADRPHYTADKLAKALGITYETRQRLELRTIGACDLAKRTRQKRVAIDKDRRSKDRKAADRKAAGMRPQSQSLAALARTVKVSRPTIYAWKQKGILKQKLAERGLDTSGSPIRVTNTGAKTVKFDGVVSKDGVGALSPPASTPAVQKSGSSGSTENPPPVVACASSDRRLA